MDVNQTNDFYRWLKERDLVERVREQPRVRVEIPLPPVQSTPEKSEDDNRGVCVINLY